ncbi:MAG: polysaccharide pyruvyl transferase family protein, partial [Clostridia bacterium]|nr:polysaccharide pyruvyl transferase family protein [Clostridia bacterium]
ELQDQISAWLKTFDSISVREKSGLSILEQLGVKKGKRVLDPVFLLSKEEWESMIPASPLQSTYMLYYGFDGNEEVELAASRFAHENGCKLVNTLGGRYSDIDCREAGPLEFLALLRDADTVLSSSFHATAFSLIFEKNFQIFKRESAINSRMLDLLRTVGLEEHLVDNYGFKRIETDFSTPRRLLSYEIQNSKDYLQSILSLAEARVGH